MRLKFIKISMFQNKALTSKKLEMRDRRRVTKVKLKGVQMQNQAQEDSIRNIACSANRICPKASRSPMLIEHHPSYLNESVVRAFDNFILLRNTWGRKLLINTMLKAKLIKRGIPELSPIVTANGFQAVRMFIVQPQSQDPKVLKHLILAFQEENPRVTRIVVNDDKNISLATHGVNSRGADSVHMEQLSGLLNHHGINWRMGSSDHLAKTTRSTNKVTLKLEQGQYSE
jgi:hypothetical protein